MNTDIMMVFDRWPGTLPLYQLVEVAILERFPEVEIHPAKTQVAFSSRYRFAWVWPPFRRIKGRPGTYVVLTFGLDHQVAHPRIVETVEPYPGRWTHHVLIAGPEDLDAQAMDWLEQSYRFSRSKGRRR